MGMVFQEGGLFDSLSVLRKCCLPLREAGENDEAVIERRVREVLGFVEMEHAIDKLPSELSGGMRRRVSIARAIVNQPEIILYDSPTAGLDPVTAHTITVLIAKLRDVGRVTSIVVTHRLQDAYVLANFVFAPDKKALVPVSTNGGPAHGAARALGHAPATRVLVLRDTRVYFQGSVQELARAPDAYLQRFLA